MKAVLCIDDAVGEHRRALLDTAGRAFRLETERWSERGKRARLDEIWWGRVQARMPGNRGWFVDLGLERDGVIEPTKATAVTEGAMLALRIKSEAWSDKGPVLSLADMPASTSRPSAPQFHAAAAPDLFLRGVEVVETRTGMQARQEIDAAIDEASALVTQLPGGGDISIETTRALTAIDVDVATRIGEHDAAGFALNLNLAAAEESARQISLRGIGGLLAIDFVRMQDKRDQRAAVEAFRQALASRLGRTSEVLELSPLGVCEAAIARRARPLADALAWPLAEQEALQALREIETAGTADRAARIRARVSAAAAKWLATDEIGWQAALAGRIGQRWTLEAADRAPGRPEVWSAT